MFISRHMEDTVKGRRLTSRQVRKGFIYSEHIARRTKRGTIYGLEIIVSDKKVVHVQALRTCVERWPVISSNFEH